ncbi:MAG: MXAN_5808 family serine peptidase [Deltaproteobacteria bacterium]|jgi:carboxyl-terminal processing protease
MQLKSLFLVAVCGALAWGGYEVSHLRAGMRAAPFSEVLAAAGGESGFLLGSDGSGSDRNYRISSLSVFSNVALHVKDNYVEPDRIDPKAMLVASLNEIERQIAEVLVEDAGKGRLSIKVMDEEKLLYIDDVESLWEINLKLREVFRFFEKNLPPQQDVRAIEYAAVNGALSTLDPHSVLLKPEAFAEMKTSTKGEFGGLGIVISVRDGKLTIISPLDGTPASRAGLEAGDIISRIGDVSTVSMPIEEAVRMLRGPEGSKVTIWVDRKGWADSRRFNIVRERIKIESVESKLLANRVGYIKIKNFQQNTGKDLDERLEKLSKEAGGKLAGVVLDLRNNPGGLLEQAIRVSDKFLTSGDIVTTVGYGNKLREPKRARWSGTESEVPVAVLVNKGSASASEIVAGALKNLDRAVVIGERTFGKGSVQVLYDFADNSALKLTIAQYLTPGGISIQNEGVTPDIELKPAWVEEKSVRLFYEPKGHREKNLKSHLERAGKKIATQQPKFELTYLLDQNSSDDEGDEDETPAPADGFNEDYPIKFAREFLVSVGRASRSKMLQVGSDFVKKRAEQEVDRVAARLGDLGVDWTEQKAPGATANADLLVSLGLEKHPTNQVTAGDEVELIARVENQGTTTLHRLRGIIDSEHPAFRGREFMFGKLGPGEVRTWKVSTKVAKEAASRSDLLELELTADEGEVEAKAVLPVVTQYIPHPQFAYSYAFDDEKRGDGDGVLEVGEGVDFIIYVTNTGPGDADDVTLRLKSGAKEDLFLERGRVTVGAIKGGGTAVGRLRFRVPTAQSDRGKLPLELTIYDAGTGEWLEDQFDLVAAPASADKRVAKKGGVAARRNTLLRSGASVSSDVLASVEKGTRFEAMATSRGFTLVKVMEGASAWIKSSDLQSSGKPKALPSKLTYAPKRRPPSIALVDDLGGSILDRESVKLEGTITARKLRDMYVLVNDEKVFFKSGPKAPTASEKKAAEKKDWAAPDDDAVKMPFEVDLTLEEGLNKVLVVARLDEKVITYRSLFVSRRSGSTPAVAEAREKPSNDKKAN